MDRHGFYGVYHMSLGQTDLIAEAFEQFLCRIIEDEEINSRALSNDSKLFEDTLISRKCCICRELYDNFGTDLEADGDAERGHHPHCPMYK